MAWSMGNIWLSSFFAYASSYPVNKIDISRYMRRIITYGEFRFVFCRFALSAKIITMVDPPYHSFGFPHPPVAYHPVRDTDIPPEDRLHVFGLWISGYFAHNISDDGTMELEQRTALAEPPPTVTKMTPDELGVIFSPAPASPGGSDAQIFVALSRGGGSAMRTAALYPDTQDGWSKIEWRYVWCDRSGWEMPFGAAEMRKELAEAEKAGRKARKVVLVRWRGANHFVSCGIFLYSTCLTLLTGALGPSRADTEGASGRRA